MHPFGPPNRKNCWNAPSAPRIGAVENAQPRCNTNEKNFAYENVQISAAREKPCCSCFALVRVAIGLYRSDSLIGGRIRIHQLYGGGRICRGRNCRQEGSSFEAAPRRPIHHRSDDRPGYVCGQDRRSHASDFACYARFAGITARRPDELSGALIGIFSRRFQRFGGFRLHYRNGVIEGKLSR